METKNLIISEIGLDKSKAPYSFIINELQKLNLFDEEIHPNVRRIVREWYHFYNEVKDASNLSKLQKLKIIICKSDVLLFIENKAINIPSYKVEHLHEEYGPEFVNTLIEHIKNKVIDFPYKRYSITNEEVNTMIANCREFTSSELVTDDEFTLPISFSEKTLDMFPNYLKLNGRYQYFKHNDREYNTIDVVTDYFTEHNRMSSVRNDQIPSGLSPYELWVNAHEITQDVLIKSINDALTDKKDFNMKLLRNKIYESSFNPDGFKESTQFKITLGISVIKHFCSDVTKANILDISAGWGDRLIAAASCNVNHYFACDPNTELQEGHRHIIEKFVRNESKHKYKINYEPFETSTLPSDVEYDLIFTSPPFFDLEIYSKDDKQSVMKHSDGNKWLVNFLFVSLKKAWNALKLGGHMAIHISDPSTLKICEPMVLFSQWKLSGCNYIGVLGSLGGAGQVRPIWVFEKITSGTMSRDAEKSLKENYPDVYELSRSI